MLMWISMLVDGTIVGAYRVLRKLGEGGMGVVYIGEHTLLGRKAAIKVLRTKLSTQEEVVQRFFNEAKAVTQIADPGIVQVFDFGYHTDGSAFIIMELLEGEAMDTQSSGSCRKRGSPPRSTTPTSSGCSTWECRTVGRTWSRNCSTARP